MRQLTFLTCFIFIGISAIAQTGYTIKGTIKGLPPQPFTLAHYFGSSQYIVKDTAVADNSGSLTFTGDKHLPEGVYMLLSPTKRRIAEFIIGKEQHFTFSSDTVNVIANMKIEGSSDNELYYKFQQQIAGYNGEISILTAQMKMRQDLMTQTKINNLRRQIFTYYRTFAQENANTLPGKIMKANLDIELPAAPKRPDGRVDSAWLFQYYKTHFWDNFDFSDDRLVRTSTLQRKLDRYIQEVTFQDPDSLIQSSDFVIEKALKGGNKEMQSYCIWYLTNKAENPAIIGGEQVFVHLAEKYYIGGIMPSTDSSTVQNIRQKVNTLKPLLVGKTMPALSLTDTTGKMRSLADLNANYTIVMFYDPDCSHCRQSTPVLKEFYEKNKKTLGLQILAASVARAPEQWKKYISDFGVQEWIHGYDYSFRIDFRKDFDVVNTPMIYVLDRDKKIIARRIPAEQLDGFMDYYQQRLAYEKATKVK
ncbi:thioredoxin-like domain-containing protein [Runella sp.]|uniref:thioredoxin-like domain-containing protein n=1 Tax=Runella sp. TaxID=1960881 RepID=UPI003D102B7C